MKYDLTKFEELREQGYLRKSENDNLVLYKYTDKCTFDRHWNEYTRVARGIILEKSTGEVVAKPFSKFFNLGELEESFLVNLPSCDYNVFEKMDGSLGIIYNYNNEWKVATCGSLNSDQAIEAQKILLNYDLEGIREEITILVEIIYPSNKIIVNYGNRKELVLLGAFNRTTGEEINPSLLVNIENSSGLTLCSTYKHNIEEMIELQKTLHKDQEGFVVRFDNGFRVKIKGKEYLRIAKIMSHLSPLSLWEVMSNGKVQSEYLIQLPEEFRKEVEPLIEKLELQYKQIETEINNSIGTLKEKLHPYSENWKRDVGMFLKENKLDHSSAIFPFLLDNKEALNNYIMKTIRPNGNEFKELN